MVSYYATRCGSMTCIPITCDDNNNIIVICQYKEYYEMKWLNQVIFLSLLRFRKIWKA